eukprot:GILJ01012895.1.p1 GENE.GILJ01012895.1~~GILJ01012895.1.p1  ORF type:complete len:137 (+),score=14.93 GILJ01012895.1:43-411(+)
MADESEVSENYRFSKRPAFRPHAAANEIYITRQKNLIVYFNRAQELFDSGESEVVIHGLGAAIEPAIRLANLIKQRSLGKYTLSVNTNTVPLIDDYEPLQPDVEEKAQVRYNSAVHIRIRKP